MRWIPYLLIAFLVVSRAPAAFGEEAPSPGAPGGARERVVPEPPQPGLETVPRGLAPRNWETWAVGQGLEPMRRWSLSAFGGFGGVMAETEAGTGEHAPHWGDITGPGPAFGVLIEFKVVPALSVHFHFALINLSGNDFGDGSEVFSSEQYFETQTNTLIATGLGLKIVLPFSHLDGLFRFRHAEANTGLSVYVKLQTGLAHIDTWQARYEDYNLGISYDFAYFESTQNLYLGIGAGWEYRWSSIGIFLEFVYHDFGLPNPSSHPDWEKVSVASALKPATFNVGIGYHF